jgi:hypothetical protein
MRSVSRAGLILGSEIAVAAMSIVSSDRGIRAIETHYRGCYFRSRLEARWAVFFQMLDVPWHLEPEGFVLSTGARYLPDFLVHLKDRPLWVEIKPADLPVPQFEQFMEDIKQPAPDPESVTTQEFVGYDFWWSEGWDNYHKFCICVSCGGVGFEFMGRSERIQCGCNKLSREGHTSHHPKMLCQRRPRQPWPVEGHARHRELPDRGSRWPCRALRGLRLHDHCL